MRVTSYLGNFLSSSSLSLPSHTLATLRISIKMTSDFHGPPKPFTIEIPKEEIAELHKRLENARWPVVDSVVDDLDHHEKEQAFGMGQGQQLLPLSRV